VAGDNGRGSKGADSVPEPVQLSRFRPGAEPELNDQLNDHGRRNGPTMRLATARRAHDALRQRDDRRWRRAAISNPL